MANVNVKENHLTFDGVKFFRGNAGVVQLGCIGEKRDPIGGQNYLEVKDQIPAIKFKVAKSTVVDIDFKKSSESAFNTAAKAIVKGVPVQFNNKNSIKKFKSGELKLVKLSVLNNNMKKAANNSPRKLQSLINWGKDARIAHQVFVVMDAKMANKYDNNVDVDISVGVEGLEAKVSSRGKFSGETKVKLSKDTCFAYLLAKIDWNAKQKKNKTKIVDLNDDQWGFN